MGDIRNMLNNQIKRLGIDVLIVNSSKRIRCKCFNNSTNEGLPSCNICLGKGYISSIRKERVIIDYGNRLSNTYSQSQYGNIDNQLIYVYVSSSTTINQGDKIIIVGWTKQKQLSDVKEILNVGSINQYRMNDGRIEGISMTCISSSEMFEKYNSFINSLSNRTRKTISEGGVYICPA